MFLPGGTKWDGSWRKYWTVQRTRARICILHRRSLRFLFLVCLYFSYKLNVDEAVKRETGLIPKTISGKKRLFRQELVSKPLRMKGILERVDGLKIILLFIQRHTYTHAHIQARTRTHARTRSVWCLPWLYNCSYQRKLQTRHSISEMKYV